MKTNMTATSYHLQILSSKYGQTGNMKPLTANQFVIWSKMTKPWSQGLYCLITITRNFWKQNTMIVQSCNQHSNYSCMWDLLYYRSSKVKTHFHIVITTSAVTTWRKKSIQINMYIWDAIWFSQFWKNESRLKKNSCRVKHLGFCQNNKLTIIPLM